MRKPHLPSPWARRMSRARLRALGTALPGRAPRTLIVSVAVLAIAAVSLAVAPSAQATEIERRHPGGEVRIEARYATALQGIDPLVFDVTRSGASVDDLDIRVTVSSGIVSARKLRTAPPAQTRAWPRSPSSTMTTITQALKNCVHPT